MVRGVVSISVRKMEMLKGELRLIKGALDQMQGRFDLLVDEFAQLQHEDFSAADLAASIAAAAAHDEEAEWAKADGEGIAASQGHANVSPTAEAVPVATCAATPAPPAEGEAIAGTATPTASDAEQTHAIAGAAPAAEEEVRAVASVPVSTAPAEEVRAIASGAMPTSPAEVATPAAPVEEASAIAGAVPAVAEEASAIASAAMLTAPAETEDALDADFARDVTEIAAAETPEAEDREWPIADADENAAVIPEIAASSPCAEYVLVEDIAPCAPRAIVVPLGSSEANVAETIAATPPVATTSAPISFAERRRSRELKREKLRPDRLSRYAAVAAVVAMIVAMALVSSGVSGAFAGFLQLGPTDTQPS